jgi:hypothetical protein
VHRAGAWRAKSPYDAWMEIDELDRAIIRVIGEHYNSDREAIHAAQIGTALLTEGLPEGEDEILRAERMIELAKQGLVKRVPVPPGHVSHVELAFYKLTPEGWKVFNQGDVG